MRCLARYCLVLLVLLLANRTDAQTAQQVEIKGKIRADIFTGIGGVALAGLTGNANYPDNPNEVHFLDAFEFPPGLPDGTPPAGNVFDNYGTRIWGWITPKRTSTYVFYLAADDQGELWLSTDDKPENRVLIANEPTWNPVRAWDSTARRPGCPDNGGARCNNISAPIRLEANKKYFIEALAKEGGGGDNLAVTWAEEGGIPPVTGDPPLAAAEVLSAPAAAQVQFKTHPQNTKQEVGKTARFTAQINAVYNPQIQWLKNGQAIAGATSLSYETAPLAASDNNAKYKVRVTVGGASAESNEATLSVVAAAKAITTGFLKAEVFTGIGGVSLDGNLRFDDKYINNRPDRVEFVTLFEYPPGTPTVPPPGDVMNNYGVRLSGFIAPTETASYIFHLAADDNGELYLSTDENPANEVLIASEPQWNPVRAFASTDRRPNCPDFCDNVSGPVRLQAGKRYWVRAEMKEGGGGDNLAVAWRKEGDPPIRNGAVPILGSHLASESNPNLAADITITEQPKAATVTAPEKATFTVKVTTNPASPISYRWQKNGVDIPGAAEATYTTSFLSVADNGAKIRAVVSVPGKSLNSDEVTLTVNADTKGPSAAKIVGSDKFNQITVTFSEPVTAATAGAAANYSLSGGLTISSVTVLDTTTVRLSTSQQAQDTEYTLTLRNIADNANNVVAAPTNTKTWRSFKFTQGVMKFEAWTGIGSTSLPTLTDDPRYPDSPDVTRIVTGYEGPTNWSDNYGARVSGWITPQETASYVFFMSTDDNGELWLSTDDLPANKKLLASEPQWSGVRSWTTSDRRPGCPDACENRSLPVPLQAGKRYYTELLYKEGGGGDNGAVTWIKQGSPPPANGSLALVGNLVGTFTDPAQGPPIIVESPKASCVDPGSTATLSVNASGSEPFTYQWRFRGTDIQGATGATLSIPNAGARNIGNYTVLVKNAEGEATSAPASLLIKNSLIIEAEDFNFEGGNYIKDKPTGMTGKYPGGDYQDRGGLERIDFFAPGGNAGQTYRPDTGVAGGKRNAHSDGLVRCDFVLDVNHVVGWNDSGDWYNYTRTFPEPAKDYNILGRISSGGEPINGQLDEVTAGAKTTNQTLKKLGVFRPGRATAGWDTFELFPLTDDSGALVSVNLGGERTLRFTTLPGNMDIDYLMFVPAVGGPPTTGGPKFSGFVRDGNNLKLEWSGGGTLEAADEITGPWSAVANAASPATIPVSGNRKFYRIRQ